MRQPSLTIGIEEEYQIIDPQTGELRSFVTQSLEEDHVVLREFDYAPRLRQHIIEIGTSVCRTPAEAGRELVKIRRGIAGLAEQSGFKIMAAGSHPYNTLSLDDGRSIPFTSMGIKQDERDLDQRRLTFSTHIHVTIEDREFLIDAMNVARYLLPHLLCLATSSPFWQGQDTGLKSYRSVFLRGIPRTGIPRVFSSWADYTQLTNTLVQTNCIPDGRQIFWDIRPNWAFPTLELRICDVCTKVEEAVCVAAIFQAIVAKLWKLRYDNMTFRHYPSDLIEENKWRAARYGLDGLLIDFGKQKEVPSRDLIDELVSWFIDDVVDELGSREEVAYALKIMEQGTSADRQLARYGANKNLKSVVEMLVGETNNLPGYG